MGNCCGTMEGPTAGQGMPVSPFERASQQEKQQQNQQQQPAASESNGFQQFFQNPLKPFITEDEETVAAWQHIRQSLTQASRPVLDNRTTANVNVSIFGKDRGRSYTSGGFQRLDSMLPKQGAPFLNWTHSRKLLEAAIAAEQQTGPDQQQQQHRRQPVNEWDRVAAAEERLQRKLFKFQLQMFVMEGDGNCQFRAVSFGLYGSQDYHAYVRQQAVEHMRRRHKDFEAFLGQDVDTYLHEMSRPGVWGDELTLRAICDAFGICINVITSDADNWFLRYLPSNGAVAVQHEVFLTYIAPIHYNAIRRIQGSNLDSSGSFSKKHSMILRAVNEFQQRAVLPDNPERLAELAGRV